MSAPLFCTRCGYQNQSGHQYCTNCGALLGVAAAAPGPVSPPAYGYPPPSYDYERTKQVDRTKTGVLLLLLGTLLTWIPYDIGIIGYLLLFIGAILVILGRKTFGETHSRNVVASIVLFIVGILVVIGVALFVVISNLPSIVTPGGTVSDPAVLRATLSAGLIGGIAAAVIIGIAEVLFTYGLQLPTGRVLLWAGYGANIAVSIVLYVVLSPLLPGIQTSADYNAVVGQQNTLQLLIVIPSVLFAAADYLAWSRISRGEIPPRAAPPPMPAPVAPVPPAPPATPPPSGPAPPVTPP